MTATQPASSGRYISAVLCGGLVLLVCLQMSTSGSSREISQLQKELMDVQRELRSQRTSTLAELDRMHRQLRDIAEFSHTGSSRIQGRVVARIDGRTIPVPDCSVGVILRTEKGVIKEELSLQTGEAGYFVGVVAPGTYPNVRVFSTGKMAGKINERQPVQWSALQWDTSKGHNEVEVTLAPGQSYTIPDVVFVGK